jgi:hypothetical protein
MSIGGSRKMRWMEPRRRVELGDELDDCWEWTGLKAKGYGRVMINGHGWQAHRLMFTIFFGPPPPTLEMDHLCRNRACINPLHLEPVSRQENARRAAPWWPNRATHCRRGHPYDETNTYFNTKGRRECRACRRLLQSAWHPAARAENPIQSYHNAAKTHCPQGHPYDEANTYRNSKGGRECRTCIRARQQQRRKTPA